jgi:hypothetical protein
MFTGNLSLISGRSMRLLASDHTGAGVPRKRSAMAARACDAHDAPPRAGSPDEKPAPLLRSGIAGILQAKSGRFGAA